MAQKVRQTYSRGGYPLNADTAEVLESLYRFQERPDLHREIISNNPKNFAFTWTGERYIFGLSKCCAFRNMSCQQYIDKVQGMINSGNLAEHIELVTGQEWLPEKKFSADVQAAFRDWIDSIFGGFRTHHDFKLMEISEHETARGKRQHDISPETLFKQLAAKRELGEKAEKIAYEYELERVRKEGCRQPKKHVDHVSRRVTNAGYDIVSTFNKKRYIEVKGTSRKQPQIYLTRNEYNFLKKHGKEAYLYVVVFIQDKDPQMRRIPDPIPWLEEHSSLATELYFATLPGETKG